MRFEPEMMLEWFREYAKKPEKWQVGLESERFAVFPENGRPLPYIGGERCVSKILRRLVDHHGFTPCYDGGSLLAAEGPVGTITIEPGSQMEIALKPATSLQDVQKNFRALHGLLMECSEHFNFAWLSSGTHPFATSEDISMIPKKRYVMMKEYFNYCGKYAHEMMRATCSVQVSLDYENEEHFKRMFFISNALAPVVTAWFANSYHFPGIRNSFISKRSYIWRNTDKDRCGLIPGVLSGNFGFKEYVDYVLDVPMIFRYAPGKIDGDLFPGRGITFREYVNNANHQVDLEEFLLQMTGIFTLTRAKNYVEIRSCDALPIHLTERIPALWCGLLYAESSLSKLEELIGHPNELEFKQALKEAAESGFEAKYRGRPLRQWCLELSEIAKQGLTELPKHLALTQQEAAEQIEPLAKIAESGLSLSGKAREQYGKIIRNVEHYLAENRLEKE